MEGNDPTLNFQTLLRQLALKVTPYTEIYIIEIDATLIHFRVTWILNHKYKNYRIICTQNQLDQYLTALSLAMSNFPIKKINLSANFVKQQNLSECIFFNQHYQNFLTETNFDQVLLPRIGQFNNRLISTLFTVVSSTKITVTQPFAIEQISYFTRFVHQEFPKRDVNLCFNVDMDNYLTLLDFIQEWNQTLPEKPETIGNLQKKFGYPFPLQPHKPFNSQRREQISIFNKQKQLLTVRQLNNFGCVIIFKGIANVQLLSGFIKILLGSNRFISLELQALQNEILVNFVEYVMQNLQESKYHISIGNQIELTTQRLVLNTTGLSREEVKYILELMKHPGHYQLICYSTAQHFPAAVSLFRSKPLIKFNFFVPFEEFQLQRQELIRKMEKHADQLLLKVYSYAGLLKNMAGVGYLAVNTIFYTLGQQP